MRRVHVSRGRADRAYVGTAYLGEVGEHEHYNRWYSSIWRSGGRCGGGASAAQSGSAGAGHEDDRGRQRNDFGHGTRSPTTYGCASAAAAERGTIRAADRDAAGDQHERGAKLFGQSCSTREITISMMRRLAAGCSPVNARWWHAEIAKRAARTCQARGDARNACFAVYSTTKSVAFL